MIQSIINLKTAVPPDVTPTIVPMLAADDDIETRLTIVERDVAQLREHVALTSSERCRCPRPGVRYRP
jgi:hypothetical protein